MRPEEELALHYTIGEVVPSRYGERVVLRSADCFEPPTFSVPIPRYYHAFSRLHHYGKQPVTYTMDYEKESCIITEYLYWGRKIEHGSYREINELVRKVRRYTGHVQTGTLLMRFLEIGLAVKVKNHICFNEAFALGNFLDFGFRVDPFEILENLKVEMRQRSRPRRRPILKKY